jgi:dTDP-glucose 4,6-dehydratase
MKVLVAGGAGFIGSHYVRTMLAAGYPEYGEADVTVLDKLSYAGSTQNLPMDHPQLDFIKGDIRDADLLRQVLPGHDAVLHFAAESHVDRSLSATTDFVQNNVLGTQILLETCRETGVEPVVVVSTDEVYGSIAEGAWGEERPLLPNSPYAASKAACDLIARAYTNSYGLDVRITRCSNNYGPYQHPEKLIPLFVTNLLSGKKVPLYGDGRNVREWIHVDDHCRAIQLVLTRGHPGEVYNVGGGTAFTNIEMTRILLGLCGADTDMVEWTADRPGHDLRYALDDRKIREQLGFTNEIAFDKGIMDVVRWYRENRYWWTDRI